MIKRRSIIALLVVFWGLVPLGLMRLYLPKVWEKRKEDRSQRTAFWKMPDEFVGYFGDGWEETATYNLDVQGGPPIITVKTSVVDFSNSRRVPLGDEKRTIADTIPTLRAVVTYDDEKLSGGLKQSIAYVALSPFNGCFGGSVTTSESLFFDGRRRAVHFEKDGVRFVDDPSRSGRPKLDSGAMPMTVEALYLWARGFAGPELSPGETRRLPILVDGSDGNPATFEIATFMRGESDRQDSFVTESKSTHTMSVSGAGGPIAGFIVENAWPRKVRAWVLSDVMLVLVK